MTHIETCVAAIVFDVPYSNVTPAMVDALKASEDLTMFADKILEIAYRDEDVDPDE